MQCSGSVCFWASWRSIRICNLFVRIGILTSTSKKIKKNRDFFMTFYLWKKNDLNVPSKRNKHKNLEKQHYFLLAVWRSLRKRAGSTSGSVSHKYGSEDPHPDPYQYDTDPEHWTVMCYFLRPSDASLPDAYCSSSLCQLQSREVVKLNSYPKVLPTMQLLTGAE